MDPLTHTATGLFLYRAGLERYSPRALPVLLLAANAPDIDIVFALGGQLAYLNWHRHFTHSLAFLPVMALLPVLLVRLVSRKRFRWGPAWAIAAVAVGSHLLLDTTNIYGVRLFEPFSAVWVRWDLTSVVDLWIWGFLAFCILAPFLVRLVGSEIGSARSSAGRGFAWAALSFLLLYNLAHWVLHERAVAVLESRIYAGSQPSRVAAFPSPVNPLLWRGLVDLPDAYVRYQLDLTGEFRPSAGAFSYKPERGPAVDAAGKTVVFQDFLRFAQYPLYTVTPEEDGTAVELNDLRFSAPGSGAFAATAFVNRRHQVESAGFHFGSATPR